MTLVVASGSLHPWGFLGMSQLSCSLLGSGSCFPQADWGPVAGKGGGSATKAGTVPAGVWGGLKGPPHPPTAARQR